MLILTRRVSEAFIITPGPMVDLATPVGDLFALGPIEIAVGGVHGTRVKFSVVADPRLLILRNELYRKHR